LANTYIPTFDSLAIRGTLWALYTIFQGLAGTGIWVLAHECGHQAFSDYGWVNDLVGWVLHSSLLVPYFSWKYSHGKHHKATGHLTRDTVFVPATTEKYKAKHFVEKLEEFSEDAPIITLKGLLIQQLGGWWAYLASNVTGQPYPDTPKWKQNHFVPDSPLFEKREYWFIVLSDIGILIQSMVLYKVYKTFGPFLFFMNYFIPYMFVNHWLVFITYLQHTSPTLPHYDHEEWNFARGAAATIDRELPFVGPFFFHDIIETHVLHHYVSRIPFYNARPASEAIKKVMGKHYQYEGENMFVSLWKTARSCQFVDGDNGVRMFRNRNNIGVKVVGK
jgi:omega-6 fatty acid desaturase (delta-12 desaturase)